MRDLYIEYERTQIKMRKNDATDGLWMVKRYGFEMKTHSTINYNILISNFPIKLRVITYK